MGRLFALTALAGVVALAVVSMPDIKRYLEIRSM